MDPAVALELQVQQESTSRSRICTVIAVMACIVMGCFLLLGFSLKRNDELVAILDQYREYLNQQVASSTNAQAAVAAAAALRARGPSQIKRALPRHNASRTDGAQVVFLNAPPQGNLTPRRRKMHPSKLIDQSGHDSHREKIGPAIASSNMQQQIESGFQAKPPNSIEQHTPTNARGNENASLQSEATHAIVTNATNDGLNYTALSLSNGTDPSRSPLQVLNGTVHELHGTPTAATFEKMLQHDQSNPGGTGRLVVSKMSTPSEDSGDEMVTEVEDEFEGTLIVLANSSHPSKEKSSASAVTLTLASIATNTPTLYAGANDTSLHK
ncbi:unnamed protein product [Ixodes persulcatus]